MRKDGPTMADQETVNVNGSEVPVAEAESLAANGHAAAAEALKARKPAAKKAAAKKSVS